MERYATAVFVVNLAVTHIMCGALWLTQLSYYPLLGAIGRLGGDASAKAERAHIHEVAGIAWLMMTLELATSALLLWVRPASLSLPAALAGMGLILVIWIETLGHQFRFHKLLAVAYSEETHRKLMRTNWIRVIAWSLRALLLLSAVTRLR